MITLLTVLVLFVGVPIFVGFCMENPIPEVELDCDPMERK
jgi:hypothetical protein